MAYSTRRRASKGEYVFFSIPNKEKAKSKAKSKIKNLQFWIKENGTFVLQSPLTLFP